MASSKPLKSKIGRGIGHEIYPMRVVGYVVLCILLIIQKEKNPEDNQLVYIIWAVFFFIYPHLIFQIYRYFGSENNLERQWLALDLFWVGLTVVMVDFSLIPTIALIVYSTATCIGIGGVRLWLQGIGLFFLALLIMWLSWGDFVFSKDYSFWSNLIGFIYMFTGFNAYNFAYYRRSLAYKKVRMQIEAQKIEIAEQKEAILSSINYAKRIQDAILPKVSEIQSTLPESFVFFRPRDIVSGDFYFYTKKKHKTIIAAVDCTGHGIPGAFMSLIGNDLLNEIINVRDITEPDKILNILLREVLRALRQEETDNSDGMDVAICSIDHYPQELYSEFGVPNLEYAGAGNPLIYFQDNEMKIIKHDKIIIGGIYNYQKRKKKVFTKHCIALDKPTTFYIFSDGIQDQFGGERDRKFTPHRLRTLLQNIYREDMSTQKKEVIQTINNWQGSQMQIDDMLLIGAKVG